MILDFLINARGTPRCPRYRVHIHRKISKLLANLEEEKLKNRIISAIEKLDYPLASRCLC